MIKVLGNIELPDRLYKYRDWNLNNHQAMLSKRHAYFASPAQFNDPFDCKIPIRYDIESEKLLEDIYYRTIKAVHPDRSDKEIREFARKHVHDGDVDPSTFKKNDSEYFNELDKRMGVFSLSKHNNDILMWGHYANSHQGFCLGFETSKLLSTNNIDFIGKVNYFNEFPVILPNGDLSSQFEQQIFSKWDKWEYEDEYRLTKNHIANRVVTLPQAAFKELILGYKMNLKDRKKIIKMARKMYPEIEIFGAVPNEEKFKIEINRIE